jgi:hypothetical protein
MKYTVLTTTVDHPLGGFFAFVDYSFSFTDRPLGDAEELFQPPALQPGEQFQLMPCAQHQWTIHLHISKKMQDKPP